MKVLFGVVASVALLFSAHAIAQTATPAPAAVVEFTSQCPALPVGDPTIPNGATINARGMETANAEYVAWATGLRAAILCRQSEYEQLIALANAKRDEHNAAAARLNGITTQWQIEQADFCARPRQTCVVTEQ